VIDERDREVDFTGITTMNYPDRIAPLTKGWLKVSHRKIDSGRATDYAPKHTHSKADHAPLTPDEIVQVEVEIVANTGYIRRGHRLRVDIQPFDGAAHGMRHAYEADTHTRADNRLYTGPDHVSFIQLPIVPRSTGQ